MRRLLALLFGAAAAIGGTCMDAQSADRAHIGLLSLHSANQERAGGIGATAFRAGMQALGYTEPQNVLIEERHANGDKDRLRSLASELVAARVQVIVTVGTDATHAARESTSLIPIVMAGVGDAVRSGFVASLAHPGGNITGTAIFSPEATVKQLEVLKETVPRIRRVAVLRAPAPSSAGILNYAALENAATSLGLVLAPAVVADPSDLPHHFAQMRASGTDAFLVLASPALDDMRGEIAELGLRHRLPGVGHQPYYVQAGVLLSYGPSLSDLHARSAAYVDKILKGAAPAELPVDQAERFKLVVNLRTARTLGIELSPTLLARADDVIE